MIKILNTYQMVSLILGIILLPLTLIIGTKFLAILTVLELDVLLGVTAVKISIKAHLKAQQQSLAVENV